MNRIIQSLVISIMMASSVAADKAPQESIELLVERSYWAIDRIEKNHKKITDFLSKEPRPKNVDQQLAPLRVAMREAKGELEKLIAELKVGTSIFSYPGLIGLGRTRFIRSKDGQTDLRGTYYLEFLIGYSDTDSGGSEPRFYEVHFDRNGSILDHRVMPRMTE